MRNRRNDEAVEMMAGLSELLRYTLDHAGEQHVALEEELSVLRRYLEIQHSRFPDRMSYAIAARVEFPAAEKLRLLEERSERARLMVIVELLARGLENLAVAAEIRDRAHTNGKVAPPEGRRREIRQRPRGIPVVGFGMN